MFGRFKMSKSSNQKTESSRKWKEIRRMIGEHICSNRTVQIPQWDPTENLTVGVHSVYSSHSPSNLANGAGDYLASLYRYLPSNESNSLYATGESDPEVAVDEIWCDHFRMYVFKVKKCARGRSHDWTECPFAHPGEKARRRDPQRFQYSGTPCPDFRKGGEAFSGSIHVRDREYGLLYLSRFIVTGFGNLWTVNAGACNKGESCEFAHGVFECWLHPERYRTQPCKDGLNCSRRVCFFAHTPEQLRPAPHQSPWSPHSADSEFGSPVRHSFDSYFPKGYSFVASNFTPPPLSPPLESPPMSPSQSQFMSGSPQSVGDLVASMRGLGLGKMQLSPRGNGVSSFVSPRQSNLRPGCPFNLTPASPVSVGGGFDIWERETPYEEPAMERVESGRDLRARMYAKLSKENSLG